MSPKKLQVYNFKLCDKCFGEKAPCIKRINNSFLVERPEPGDLIHSRSRLGVRKDYLIRNPVSKPPQPDINSKERGLDLLCTLAFCLNVYMMSASQQNSLSFTEPPLLAVVLPRLSHLLLSLIWFLLGSLSRCAL